MPSKPCKNTGCANERQNWSQSTFTNVYCGPVCAAEHALYKREQDKAKAKKDQRAQWKREAREFRRKKKDKKVGPLRAAEDAVNAYVLLKQAELPCIVHGNDCPYSGNGFDAGHFVSKGSHPELRFVLFNIHRQCRSGNRGAHKWSRYGRSTDAMYEENLRARIGDAKVDWLKGPHEPKQYREQDLKRIADVFRRKKRLTEKLRAKE